MTAQTVGIGKGDPLSRLARDLKEYLDNQIRGLKGKEREEALDRVREELARGGAELSAGWQRRIDEALTRPAA